MTTLAKNIHYALPKQVNNLLRELPTFSASTDPTEAEVLQYLRRAEGYIDVQTGYGWREKRTRERLSFPEYAFTSSRKHGDTLWFDGVKLPLIHRGVKDLDADRGDVFSCRQGGSFTDYLTTKTEGLNNDYFMDNENGILHLYRRWVIQLDAKVIIDYRYGDSVESDLNGTHADDVTTLTVDSTEGFQPGLIMGFNGTGYEAMYFNQMSTTDLQGVARGQEGTTALAYSDNDPIWQVPEDINEATILLAGISIAENHALSVNTALGEGEAYVGMETRVRNWKRRVDEILELRREWLLL